MARAAAAAGATSFVRGLVARGVDVVTSVDPESLDGALHLATRFGRADTVRLLLEEAADCWPAQQNKLRQQPAYMAAACAVLAARPALSRVFDPPACDLEMAEQQRRGKDRGVTSLMIAAASADAVTVGSLLASLPPASAAAAVSARTWRRGCLPLHFASVGGSAAVVDTLLRRAGDATVLVAEAQLTDGASAPALCLASRFGHEAVVLRLLEVHASRTE